MLSDELLIEADHDLAVHDLDFSLLSISRSGTLSELPIGSVFGSSAGRSQFVPLALEASVRILQHLAVSQV